MTSADVNWDVQCKATRNKGTGRLALSFILL